MEKSMEHEMDTRIVYWFMGSSQRKNPSYITSYYIMVIIT